MKNFDLKHDLKRTNNELEANQFFDGSNTVSVRSDLDDLDDLFFKKNPMDGGRAPVGETLSELADGADKDAVFNHSLKYGVFNNIKNSPLKEKLPANIQMYQHDDENMMTNQFAKVASGFECGACG